MLTPTRKEITTTRTNNNNYGCKNEFNIYANCMHICETRNVFIHVYICVYIFVPSSPSVDLYQETVKRFTRSSLSPTSDWERFSSGRGSLKSRATPTLSDNGRRTSCKSAPPTSLTPCIPCMLCNCNCAFVFVLVFVNVSFAR